MKFGVVMFPTESTIRPDHLAVEVEARGFDSLWFPEHSHIPTSRESPWPGMKGAPLPSHYWSTYDQFVALAYAAAATSTLKLGSGITLVAQRDPIWTAKEVATLDHLSGGRFLFGVGYGWNKEEMAAHGTSYGERRALLRENVLLMKELWTQDEAAFVGELVSMAPSLARPKPLQKPHPPIVMGAELGPRTLADIAEFCDGWMSLGRHNLEDGVSRVRDAVAAAGRDPAAFQIFAQSGRRSVERLADLGVDTAVFSLAPMDSEDVPKRLDAFAEAAGLG